MSFMIKFLTIWLDAFHCELADKTFPYTSEFNHELSCSLINPKPYDNTSTILDRWALYLRYLSSHTGLTLVEVNSGSGAFVAHLFFSFFCELQSGLMILSAGLCLLLEPLYISALKVFFKWWFVMYSPLPCAGYYNPNCSFGCFSSQLSWGFHLFNFWPVFCLWQSKLLYWLFPMLEQWLGLIFLVKKLTSFVLYFDLLWR